MKVPAKVRYGLQALVHLALSHGAGPVSVKEIAEQYGISEKFLEGVFSHLRAAGLVLSTKGKGGGYTLRRPPHRITLREVVTAFEPYVIFPLSHEADEGPDAPIWADLEKHIQVWMEGRSLEELVGLVKRRRGILDYTI
ncbi:transcriptional regulator, BadM/Rrf2 family [Spirochaeta thermophila DSM 6578]|uniref:Transcriptional regulator, BadM/Rrf2 family n=1 Tax=Winmispira thermophila (strain ATCC 700085 / DSM 6578 / Z-1203) TaxID=869211 RepID=G0GBR2_WINT7|nr:Rrf2 family transcriptional regulator [Spirochaeta thermophila]AEJ61140.1 transcriptional regulator, BadM/Rrf2 family [Spirochaeta thermophila DSM 6578]